ncbi:unnamed protein product, partial [Meganyctiphanes norvegica]
MRNIIHVLVTYLLVGTSIVLSSNECRVRDKYSLDIWNGDPLRMLAFISDQDAFTCMLNFHGLDNYLFYDQIVLSTQANKVIKTENGNIEYLDIKSTVNVTGWVGFTFSMDQNSTFMVKIQNELILSYEVDYPVKSFTAYASNISLCSSKVSWGVGANEGVIIPIYSSSMNKGKSEEHYNLQFTLSSTVPFSPVITVEEKERFLTLKNREILLTKDLSQPLPSEKYVLGLQVKKQTVYINYK